MIQASIRQLRESIDMISNNVLWRQHTDARANGEDVFYLRDRENGEPFLTPEDQHKIAVLETQVAKLELKAEKIDGFFKGQYSYSKTEWNY